MCFDNVFTIILCEMNWLFNVAINAISVIYVTAHRCAGGLKTLDQRSGSQRHKQLVGFFNVPVLHRHGTTLFIRLFREPPPIWSPFTTRWGYGGSTSILGLTYSDTLP